MMRKDPRQSSFSKDNLNYSREKHQNSFNAKNNTNHSAKQQDSNEVIKRGDDIQARVPVYRVTKTNFEKNKLRYSEDSPLRIQDKGLQLSPYRHQQYEAYNFAHPNPLYPSQHRKKGRSYLYRRKEEREEDASKVSSSNSLHESVKPKTMVLSEQQTQARQGGGLTLQEMHYQMVKAYQKCRRGRHF